MNVWVNSVFLAIMNVKLPWAFSYKSLGGFMFSFVLCKHLNVALLGHMLRVLTCTLQETVTLFSKVSVPFCIPIPVAESSMRVLLGSHFHQHLLLSVLLNCSHSSGCVIVAHWGFILHIPNDSWWWICLHVLFDHSYIFFDEVSAQIFCLFLIGLSVSSLCILDTRP